MGVIDHLYGHSLSLLTDLYQLTMAYGYFRQKRAETESVFHLYFRKNPFQGGFSIACGLQIAIEYLERFRFTQDDIDYLSTLTGNDGKALFRSDFLKYLRDLRFTCNIDAIPEGTAVFPNEPLIRVQGPILQAQILETALLNIINFQTLIATKSARVCLAAKGDGVLEFGLRRAQGIDGALAASRAAYVGGCAATSNVLAGKLWGIPVRGTHAHSWVMSFDSEIESFESYAEAMPNNCIFLVDTYNTINGIRHAIDVGRKLREHGHEMIGIRLDSGDLAFLSQEARKMLDDSGFHKALVVASNDLDEYIMQSLKEQGATIAVWGVGTHLVTAYDQPALGGVYKLSAIKSPKGWQYRVKLSEQAIKTSTPGILQVRRYFDGDRFVADGIFDELIGISDTSAIVDPLDMTRRKHLPPETPFQDLLVPIFRNGERVYDSPALSAIRRHAGSQIDCLHAGLRRFTNPHQYPVGLEQRLFDLKTNLILKARGEAELPPNGLLTEDAS